MSQELSGPLISLRDSKDFLESCTFILYIKEFLPTLPLAAFSLRSSGCFLITAPDPL